MANRGVEVRDPHKYLGPLAEARQEAAANAESWGAGGDNETAQRWRHRAAACLYAIDAIRTPQDWTMQQRFMRYALDHLKRSFNVIAHQRLADIIEQNYTNDRAEVQLFVEEFTKLATVTSGERDRMAAGQGLPVERPTPAESRPRTPGFLTRERPTVAERPRVGEAAFRDLIQRTGESGFNDYEQNSNRYPYLCTVIAPKGDQFGRHYLMDARSSVRRTVLVLTGAKQPVALGGVYTDNSEQYESGGLTYIRQHGNPGARIRGASLGALTYMSSATAAGYFDGNAGTASPTEGSNNNRSGSADDLWDRLLAKGITERETATSGDTSEDEVDIDDFCAPVPESRRETTYRRSRYNEVDAWVTSDEVCGTVSATVRGDGEEVETDLLSAYALPQSELVVFANSASARSISEANQPYARYVSFDSSWTLKDGKFMSSPAHPSATIQESELFRDFFHDDGVTKIPAGTCELLVRAYHGDNANVIFLVAQALQRNGTEEQVVTYLSRSDVAQAIRSDARILELLGQQRLPGVSGLSGYAHREIMQAVRLGNFAQAVKANPGNPLNFAPLSSKLAKKLAKYDLPDGGDE